MAACAARGSDSLCSAMSSIILPKADPTGSRATDFP